MSLEEDVRREVLGNLSATSDDLRHWETSRYLMDKRTAERFWDTVREAPEVVVVGDYDADGICASYIMMRAVESVRASAGKLGACRIRLPRRFSEGYGLKESHASEIRRDMPRGTAVITVDNGISSGAALEGLEASGYRVLLTDHHKALHGIPSVTMVLNPAAPEAAGPFNGATYWCGAAVAFKLAEHAGLSQELLEELEVYAALATVADCMVLREGNWGLVRRVLKRLRTGRYPLSLSILSTTLGKDLAFCDEEVLSWYLAPAFNAAGRMVDQGAAMVLEYLSMGLDPMSMALKAKELADLNSSRKEMVERELERAREYVIANGLESSCPIWIKGSGYSEGIVGLIAGKVAEEYGVPCVVLTEKNGILKGSARSAGSFDLISFLKGLPVRYESIGGHPGAAGLSITEGEFAKACLIHADTPRVTVEDKPFTLIRKDEIPTVCGVLSEFAPFGEGNPRPLFGVEIDENSDEDKLKKGETKSGKPYVFVTDQNGEWKVTHFDHDPSGLEDSTRYVLVGEIKYDAFGGREIPALNALRMDAPSYARGNPDEEQEIA